MVVVYLRSWAVMFSCWAASWLIIHSISAQLMSDGQDSSTENITITEYYELVDEGEEICDGRTDGRYPLRDARKYLLCYNRKIIIEPCDNPLVYDANMQRCGLLANISKDYFCRFRGDGNWQSPWDSHEIIKCNKGNTTVERCEDALIYHPHSNDCMPQSEILLDMCDSVEVVSAKVGCYKKEHMTMDLLIDDDKTRLNWSKFTQSVQSLLCRCSKKAHASGYTFISIRLFAQCWAGRNRTALDALLTEPTNKHDQYCYSNISKTNFENCNDRDLNVCVGSEYGQYIYDLAAMLATTNFQKRNYGVWGASYI